MEASSALSRSEIGAERRVLCQDVSVLPVPTYGYEIMLMSAVLTMVSINAYAAAFPAVSPEFRAR